MGFLGGIIGEKYGLGCEFLEEMGRCYQWIRKLRVSGNNIKLKTIE